MRYKTAYMGVFLAFALVLSYVESLIPFYFGIPGVKLGLANLAIILALFFWGAKEALILNVLRVFLAGFMFGNLFMILYSIAGALSSLGAMILMKKTKKFSIVGVSVIGGVAHNVGQIIIAIFVVETIGVSYYLPILLIAGAITGLIIGGVSMKICNIWKGRNNDCIYQRHSSRDNRG